MLIFQNVIVGEKLEDEHSADITLAAKLGHDTYYLNIEGYI